jgi:N-acetylmuramoyl-L-alanine amidase
VNSLPLILALALPAAPGTAVRTIPRPDGLLLEFRAGSAICPGVGVEGYRLSISTGSTLSMPVGTLSLWADSAELLRDSTVLGLSLGPLVAGVDWALSPDSMSLLVFLRSDSLISFPILAWAGPPLEPPALEQAWTDSMAAAAFQNGELSPWLSQFDCIVLDPGHGGRDPGAVGAGGDFEKDRALEIALLVRDLLALEMPGVKVVLTRSDDSYMSLGARTRLANSNRADLFVSIHCNASTRREANGFETYFLSLARTDDARAVAALENGALSYDEPGELQPQSDALSFLLADIAQNLFLDYSSSIAGLVQQSIAAEWPSGDSRGVKQAGFYVLRGTWMPAVLVEAAFISNPGEEALLRTLDFRFRISRAIVAAIESFAFGQGVSW